MFQIDLEFLGHFTHLNRLSVANKTNGGGGGALGIVPALWVLIDPTQNNLL